MATTKTESAVLTDEQIDAMLKEFAIAVMFGSLEDRKQKGEVIRAALSPSHEASGEADWSSMECRHCGYVDPLRTPPSPQPATTPSAEPAPTYPPCKGLNCGATDGVSHSAECQAEHAAAVAGGTFVPAAAEACKHGTPYRYECDACEPAATKQPAGEVQEPLAWIHEDELPEGYPYDAMFPYSKVDVVRMFPVFGPRVAGEVQEAVTWLDLPTYRPVRLEYGVTMHRDVVPNDAGWVRRSDLLASTPPAAPAVPEGWQPIETAPAIDEGGPRVLLAVDTGTQRYVTQAYWDAERMEWWEENTHHTDAAGSAIYGATHWMPLPLAPQQPKEP